jgi:hypothetical protein
VPGTSFENGQEYFEIAFSEPWPPPREQPAADGT